MDEILAAQLAQVQKLIEQGYSNEEALRMVSQGVPQNPSSISFGVPDRAGASPFNFSIPANNGTQQTNNQNNSFGITPRYTSARDFSNEREYLNYSIGLGKTPEQAKQEWVEMQGNPQTNSLGQSSDMTVGRGDFDSRRDFLNKREQEGVGRQQAEDEWNEMGRGAGQSSGFQGTGKAFPYMFPGGSDISTELYMLGRGIGSEKGTPGRGLTIAAAAGSALFDAARNVMSGIGYAKRDQYVDNWYRQQQYGSQNFNYTPASQTRNTNNTGGNDFRNGGNFSIPITREDFQKRHLMNFLSGGMFQEGGTSEGDIIDEPISQQGMEEQVIAEVIQYLQQGVSPDDIIESLVRKGVPQESAYELVYQAAEYLQSQTNPEQSETEPNTPTEPEQTEVEEPGMVMKNGGRFNYNVGDTISFKHGGKMVKGKISKIDRKTGKIFL